MIKVRSGMDRKTVTEEKGSLLAFKTFFPQPHNTHEVGVPLVQVEVIDAVIETVRQFLEAVFRILTSDEKGGCGKPEKPQSVFKTTRTAPFVF